MNVLFVGGSMDGTSEPDTGALRVECYAKGSPIVRVNQFTSKPLERERYDRWELCDYSKNPEKPVLRLAIYVIKGMTLFEAIQRLMACYQPWSKEDVNEAAEDVGRLLRSGTRQVPR